MTTNPRSTARTIAVAAVGANVFAATVNVTLAVVGPSWWPLVLVPVSLYGIVVIVWSWRRWGRNLPTRTPTVFDALDERLDR